MLAVVALLLLELLSDGREQILVGLRDLVAAGITFLAIRLLLHSGGQRTQPVILDEILSKFNGTRAKIQLFERFRTNFSQKMMIRHGVEKRKCT